MLSAIFPTSTLNIITVIIIVSAIEIATISNGFSKLEKFASTQLPRKTPASVIVIFPRKYDVKNLVGLYFKSPRGITMGSSGIGVAAARYRRRKAQRLTLEASVLVFCDFFR